MREEAKEEVVQLVQVQDTQAGPGQTARHPGNNLVSDHSKYLDGPICMAGPASLQAHGTWPALGNTLAQTGMAWLPQAEVVPVTGSPITKSRES
jgi:hypothetical protein